MKGPPMPHASHHPPTCRVFPRLILVALGGAAAAVIGCTSTPDQGAVQKPAEAAGTTAAEPSYPYSRKEEFTAFMKTNLDKLNQDIEQLSAKIASLSAAAQAEATQKLQALREQARRLGQQFDQVQNASAGSWDNVKSDMSKAYADLQSGIRNARQWLSEKIAPGP
jgi:hypothetical protein